MIMQSGSEDGIIPLPNFLPIGQRIGFCCIFHRVIDNSYINRRTCQRTTDTDCLIESTMPDRFKEIYILDLGSRVILRLLRGTEIGIRKYLLILRTLDNTLHRARELLRKVGSIRA